MQTQTVTLVHPVRAFWSGKVVRQEELVFHYDPITDWFHFNPYGNEWLRASNREAALCFRHLWKKARHP